MNNKKVTDFFKPVRTNENAVQNPQSPLFHGPEALPQTRRENPTPSSVLSALSRSQFMNKPRVIPSSDGEESSEDSELEDPFTLLGAARPSTRPPSKTELEQDNSLKPPPKLDPVRYNFTLERLLAEKNKASALEEDIKYARGLIKTSENIRNNADSARKLFTEETAEAIMGKGGSGSRLLAALDRKDAWRIDETWELFDHKTESTSMNERPFPTSAIEYYQVFVGIEDVIIREQMLLSGFVADTVASGAILPDAVYIWMLEQICLERREDLAFAYLKVLQTKPPESQDFLTPLRTSHLLKMLGAKTEALDLNRQLQSKTSPASAEANLQGHWNIILLVRLLGDLINIRDAESVRFKCGVLIRIALDASIYQRSDILTVVEYSLCKILSRIPENEWDEQAKLIACSIMSTILRPQFRIRVLRVLPISSPRLHLFRRRLACAFLFEDGSYITKNYTSLVQLSRFTNLLRERQYKIQHNTDYAALQSLFCIFDVAIDSGATTGTTTEKDKDIDQLVDVLRNIFSRIIDTNAQDLARTEAKDTIERIQFRLIFSVRSRQRMALDMDIGRDGKSQSLLPWIKEP